MTFEQLQAEKQKYKEKNISFEEECAQAIKFIQKNKIETIKGDIKNGNTKKTSRK